MPSVVKATIHAGLCSLHARSAVNLLLPTPPYLTEIIQINRILIIDCSIEIEMQVTGLLT